MLSLQAEALSKGYQGPLPPPSMSGNGAPLAALHGLANLNQPWAPSATLSQEAHSAGC